MITFDFDKKDRLHKQILNIQKEIASRIKNINNGGCVHFAYFLSKRLTELSIKHKVYFLNYYHPVNKGDTADHVMVKVDGIGVVDGKSILKTFSNLRRRRQFKENLNVMRKHPNWNEAYKKTQNQILSNIIRKHLNGH
jgi:hypothetical protein